MSKSIFITGGASGIGRATARRFAREGWLVGLADVDEAGMRETLAMLPEGRGMAHRLDVTDRAGWVEAVAAFGARTGGRMDVLFNNAGIGAGGPIEEMDDSEIDRLIAVNFTGVINGIRAAFGLLRATPGGCILNTSSAAGIYGSAGLVVYSGTKFAVRALTEGLDIELRPHDIRVRSLMPSFIDTPLLDGVGGASNRSAREQVIEAGLEITPVEEAAEGAWRAVRGKRLHTTVGKTARQMMFAARWLPGRLRKDDRLVRDREDSPG
ncbi:MAG: SDR family oxidoreductase [Sphingomonadaceae bacterium]|nr:SDR family oxidoreductase [Sphingomonadaceae bacterium]